MNIAIFITVRNGSTRLPNKAMLNIGNIPTIEFLIKRMKSSKLANEIVMCTTENTSDDSLVEIAKRNNIEYFRGDEEDKLERWNGAAKEFNVDFFVTADGDDLFCDPYLADLAFEQYLKNNSDFIQATGVITGVFTYGISSKALKKVCEIKDTNETEMMWVYFTETNLFNIEELENVPDKYKRNDIRMTLDYIEDFDFFQKVVQISNSKSSNISIDEILHIIENYPNIKEINFFREAEWAENQRKKTKLKLKGI